jgi:hypothetical protein
LIAAGITVAEVEQVLVVTAPELLTERHPLAPARDVIERLVVVAAPVMLMLPGNETVELVFPIVIPVAVEVPMEIVVEASMLTLVPPTIVVPVKVSEARAIEAPPP